jgi:hypothetical protein
LEFQAAGGNCVIILPTLSVDKKDIYEDFIKHCTVKRDLGMFAFEGYATPLLMHIVMLFFLTPEYTSQLTKSK